MTQMLTEKDCELLREHWSSVGQAPLAHEATDERLQIAAKADPKTVQRWLDAARAWKSEQKKE